MGDAMRILGIKSGVVKRLSKGENIAKTDQLMVIDVTYSVQDSARERDRLTLLEQNGGDEYEIRAQKKVIADADQMLPDYRKRLQTAVEDLDLFIHEHEADLAGHEETAAAKAVLARGLGDVAHPG